MILEVREINTYYGMSHVLFDVSLTVEEGEVVALLGRNGAGKTTTMRSIIGLTPPKKGSIKFRGEEISNIPTHLIARSGIGYVPSERRIYSGLTVRQNLMIAQKESSEGTLRWSIDKLYDLFPKLKQLETKRGGLLSGGEQQMLAIARTLMGNPDLLLLDEPSTGLAPLVVKSLGEQVHKVKEEGHCVLLAEQNAKFGMEISDRCYVIDKGEIRYQGTIRELQKEEDVIRNYLAV